MPSESVDGDEEDDDVGATRRRAAPPGGTVRAARRPGRLGARARGRISGASSGRAHRDADVRHDPVATATGRARARRTCDSTADRGEPGRRCVSRRRPPRSTAGSRSPRGRRGRTRRAASCRRGRGTAAATPRARRPRPSPPRRRRVVELHDADRAEHAHVGDPGQRPGRREPGPQRRLDAAHLGAPVPRQQQPHRRARDRRGQRVAHERRAVHEHAAPRRRRSRGPPRRVHSVAAIDRYPPVSALPTHMTSGATPAWSAANSSPVRPNPVAISSNTSSTSWVRHSSRSTCR